MGKEAHVDAYYCHMDVCWCCDKRHLLVLDAFWYCDGICWCCDKGYLLVLGLRAFVGVGNLGLRMFASFGHLLVLCFMFVGGRIKDICRCCHKRHLSGL